MNWSVLPLKDVVSPLEEEELLFELPLLLAKPAKMPKIHSTL